ncbi:hypothetical protein D3C71_1516460 [compost metagenome]
MELSEIDLSLFARRRLETDFETVVGRRPHIAEKICDGGVAAGIASIPEFSEQPTASEAGIGLHPLPQV